MEFPAGVLRAAVFLSARRLLRGTNRARDVVTKDTGVGGVCARCPALRRRWPTSSPPLPVSQDGAASPSCTSLEWPVCVTAETLRFRNTVSRGFQGTASPWPIAMSLLIKRKNTSCVIRRRAPAWSAGHTRVLHPQVHLPARPQSPANGRQAGDALAASILVHKPPVSPPTPAGAQPTAGRAASRGGLWASPAGASDRGPAGVCVCDRHIAGCLLCSSRPRLSAEGQVCGVTGLLAVSVAGPGGACGGRARAPPGEPGPPWACLGLGERDLGTRP